VHAFTGCCPTVAMHVKDFPGASRTRQLSSHPPRATVLRSRHQPHVFEGSDVQARLARDPDATVRAATLEHLLDSIEIRAAPPPRRVAVVRRRVQFPRTANIRSAASGLKKGCAQRTRGSHRHNVC